MCTFFLFTLEYKEDVHDCVYRDIQKKTVQWVLRNLRGAKNRFAAEVGPWHKVHAPCPWGSIMPIRWPCCSAGLPLRQGFPCSHWASLRLSFFASKAGVMIPPSGWLCGPHETLYVIYVLYLYVRSTGRPQTYRRFGSRPREWSKYCSKVSYANFLVSQKFACKSYVYTILLSAKHYI